MTRRFIHHVRTERPPVAETASEARERLRDKFPRNATRRMTHLGMLLGATLDGLVIQPEDAVVYASSYAETRALEDFLKSFPAASPSLFQTSIHPSGVQQVLIGRQQSIARLWPLAGRQRLAEQALLTAWLEPAPRVIVLGGEEHGTWLLERGMASDRAFAFALLLTREPAGAAGVVQFTRGAEALQNAATPGTRDASPSVDAAWVDAAGPRLDAFVDAIAERRPLAWSSAAGNWSLAWA